MMDEEKKVIEIPEDEGEKKKGKKNAIEAVIMPIILILIIIGGFAGGCVRCTNCGSDDNRFFVYASGTSNKGVEYKSCVGPAGCLGFGINSKCWPTECISIQRNSSDGKELSGCVTYYNETGCIANSGVKSEGKYSDQATCYGVSCIGTKYVETVAETTQATAQSTCLGVKCGKAAATESHNYNADMPRQFTKGCWSNN